MVEAGGYMFREIEAELKKSEEALLSFRDSNDPKVYREHKEDLVEAVRDMREICERYEDDREAQVICEQMTGFLDKVEDDSVDVVEEIKTLDRLIERVHHMVQWRRLTWKGGYDLPFKSRRNMRESQTYRKI